MKEMQEVNVNSDRWYFKPENPESFNGLIKSRERRVDQGGFNLTASLNTKLPVMFSMSLFGCKIEDKQASFQEPPLHVIGLYSLIQITF